MAGSPVRLPPNLRLPIGKLITFALANIAGGLVQLWVLVLVLLAKGQAPSIPVLLGDGGLFFFATSLTFSSFLALAEKYNLKTGTWDLNMTIGLGGSVALAAVVFYSVVLSQGTAAPTPLSGHVLPQISCAAAALVYTFYVSVRVGYFSGS